MADEYGKWSSLLEIERFSRPMCTAWNGTYNISPALSLPPSMAPTTINNVSVRFIVKGGGLWQSVRIMVPTETVWPFPRSLSRWKEIRKDEAEASSKTWWFPAHYEPTWHLLSGINIIRCNLGRKNSPWVIFSLICFLLNTYRAL